MKRDAPEPLATFAPKAWLNYSLFDEISAHVSGQFGVGAIEVGEVHNGGAARLIREDPARVAVAIDDVRYFGKDVACNGLTNVTEYSLRLSKVLKRDRGAPRLGLQYQLGCIPDNDNWTHRLGLALPVFGGEVNPRPD